MVQKNLLETIRFNTANSIVCEPSCMLYQVVCSTDHHVIVVLLYSKEIHVLNLLFL